MYPSTFIVFQLKTKMQAQAKYPTPVKRLMFDSNDFDSKCFDSKRFDSKYFDSKCFDSKCFDSNYFDSNTSTLILMFDSNVDSYDFHSNVWF